MTTRAAVIPTGLPAASFSDGGSADFRAVHGIAEDAILLLYVGRMALEKNIEFLIEMFAHVCNDVPRAVLLIAGEGPTLDRLRKRAAGVDRHTRVRFIGYLDRTSELPACYRASDLFVFASQTETPGLVLLEATAAGLPVVSLARMGTLDVLHEGEGAVISPPDTRLFAEPVVKLAQDAERLRELGERGRTYAASWSADAKAREIFADYRALLDRHAAEDPKSSSSAGPRPHADGD